jgi:integrase
MENDAIVFEGLFKDYCTRFVSYKQNLGFKYGISSQRFLLYVNRMLNDTAEGNRPTITRSMADRIAELKKGESKGTRQGRVSLLRKLAHFIILDGGCSYVFPKGILPVYRSAFTPYVFSHMQMGEVIRSAENMIPSGRSEIHVALPVLIRLLYSSGLRLNEALSLVVDDYNDRDNSLLIHESKNFKSRVVPLSRSMGAALLRYLGRTNPGQDAGRLMFPSPKGRKLNPSYVGRLIKSMYGKAGIPMNVQGGSPNTHGLRHTFAVHALEQMHGHGLNSYLGIALLSQYLGHVSITETEKYLRLPQYKINGDEAIPSHSGRVPEVLYEE